MSKSFQVGYFINEDGTTDTMNACIDVINGLAIHKNFRIATSFSFLF